MLVPPVFGWGARDRRDRGTLEGHPLGLFWGVQNSSLLCRKSNCLTTFLVFSSAEKKSSG
jgi:hypothetical protein